jgi:hypothetical protein
MTNLEHLVRFPILDLKEELVSNYVAEGRHSEYINFFKKHLNDTEYYCLCASNPARPENPHYLLGESSRTYLAGGLSNYFVATRCEIEGYYTNVIVQKVYPKTARDFYNQDKYCVVYVSKKDIDNKFII